MPLQATTLPRVSKSPLGVEQSECVLQTKMVPSSHLQQHMDTPSAPPASTPITNKPALPVSEALGHQAWA